MSDTAIATETRPAGAADPALLAYLRTRRSVPAAQLRPPAPDGETLRAMLSIAARVPDHGKLAPWRFVVFEGDARVRAGDAVAAIAAARGEAADADALAKERGRFTRAPLVVAVVSTAGPHPKIPEWEQVLSAGAAALNLIHAAYAHGFAANWLTEWMAYDDEAKRALGIAPEERVAAFVHIGTADARPADRARPDLDALVTRYGAPSG
jgi:nitroreductase